MVSKHKVVDTINLDKVPGATPRAKLVHLVQEGHLTLGVTEDGRGMYQWGKNTKTVACRPPHCDDPTGQLLNIYDQGIATALKKLVPPK